MNAQPKAQTRKVRKPAVQKKARDRGDGRRARTAPRGQRAQAAGDPRLIVVHELLALRASVEQTVENVKLKLAAQIAELVRVLETEPGANTVRPSAKVAKVMTRRISETRLKPKKGRVKDLARVHELLDDLRELLPPQE